MKSSEIRKKFFDYFIKNGHEKVASSSLIPAQDPTLLFTNAGMNQFKDCFLGKEQRSYKTAVTIQKCVRAGGKHNDLDNVGFTKRHLTFFEMMGNFSFGDYFKEQAILFAWNLLTQEYGLSKNDLFVSIYEDDDEAFEIWNKVVGVPTERIYRFGKKDNFWQMGDTGPCGPCTEIFYDTRSQNERTMLPTQEDFDSGKLLEVWNNVFMQFDRQEDGTLVPLKQTGVDTGMGLERIASVLQGKESVYQTDIFLPLIQAIEKLTGRVYEQQTPYLKAAFHVLADHVRSTSLLIADGASPSNEGRGYVLRKIIRRAALFSQKLSDKNIFPEVARAFIAQMGEYYPELKTNEKIIISLLTHEIEQFAQNLIKGQVILEGYMRDQAANKQITGEQAFKLYDTYGFPLEVTILAAQDHGFTVDADGFEVCMQEQRQRSGKKMKDTQKAIQLPEGIVTEFVGYHTLQTHGVITALIVDATQATTVSAGQECWIVTQQTPFFVTKGGQVDDTGTVTIAGHTVPVQGLQTIDNAIACKIISPAALSVGMQVVQEVAVDVRKNTMNNHTATHLLQAALIELLGKQVKQSGSVVDPDYLRFDFTYHKNLTQEEIVWVEDRVNAIIRENIPLSIFETSYKDALDKGVIAIFGEKYNPECVRVIDVPGFSKELCGGTHVPSTGVIGAFKITEVSALSAGNRRIFAVTGPKAIELMQHNFTTVKTLSQMFKAKSEEVIEAVERQTLLLQKAQQEIKTLKKERVMLQLPTWLKQIEEINGVPFLYLVIPDATGDELREAVERIQQNKAGFYMALSSQSDKASFYVSLNQAYQDVIDLKVFAQWLTQTTGLRGGGKLGTLQGGGPAVIQDLAPLIKAGLSK